MYARLPDGKTSLFQWDTKQYLETSEDVTRVDFCFRIDPEVVYGVFAKNGRCYIPNLLIQKAGIIDALIMSTAIGTTTDRRLEIPVEERPIPPGYVATKDGAIISYDDLEDILGELKFLSTNGGTMTGDINMDGRKITGLVDPVEDSDAVRKRYVDAKFVQSVNGDTPDPDGNVEIDALLRSGGIMNGNINMNNHTIGNLPLPQNLSEAATKGYVDTRRIVISDCVLSANLWEGDGPFTQDFIRSGIRSTYTPHITPAYSGNDEQKRKQKEAWNFVSMAEAQNGKLTFTCFDAKPEADIALQIEVMR